jgi:hypothetical protein
MVVVRGVKMARNGRGVTSSAEAIQRAVDAVQAGGAWPTDVCVQFIPAIGQEVRREVGQALAKLTASKHNMNDVSPCTRCAGVARRSTMCSVHRKANAEASRVSRAKMAGAVLEGPPATMRARPPPPEEVALEGALVSWFGRLCYLHPTPTPHTDVNCP